MKLKANLLGALPVLFVLFGLTGPANAQLTQQGQEIPIAYTPPTAFIANNVPATNFNISTGVNTFLMNVQPAVTAKISITNETANACTGAFFVAVAATTQGSQSYNNSLNQWSSIALLSATNSLIANAPVDIPASATVYLNTTAISATRIALFVVNTTGACSTTTIDVVVTLTAVAVTSPLVNNTSNGIFGAGSNVQGVVPEGQNGAPVNPIVDGSLAPPTNAGFSVTGLDTFSTVISATVSNGSGTFIVGNPPNPTKSTETAIAFYGPYSAVGGTGILSPWACITGETCPANSSSNEPIGAFLNNYSSVNTLRHNLVNSGNFTPEAVFLALNNTPTFRQAQVSNIVNPVFGGNTLAGSTLVIAYYCNQTTQCVINSVADTQGNSWRQVGVVFNAGPAGVGTGGTISVWMTINGSAAAADTVTATVGSGTINGTNLLELTGLTPANLNQPTLGQQSDLLGTQIVRQDAVAANFVLCSITLSSNTTTQLTNCSTPANQTNSAGVSIPVRYYITDFQINTTTAGTATTIQLKTGTGTNCGTGTANLSAIAYPNTAVGITSIIGPRTPLLAPLSSQVCATQAGTTAGTSVIEVRGFLAP